MKLMSRIIKFSPGLLKLLTLLIIILYFVKRSLEKKNFIGYYRDKSKFDSDAFNYDLYSALDSYFMNLPEISNNNFDEIFNKFTCIILQIIDKHALIKKCFLKQKKLLKKPWIAKAILLSIKKKRDLLKAHFLNGYSLILKKVIINNI